MKSNKLKILIASNGIFSSIHGGLERTTVNLVRYLSQQNNIECFTLFNKYVDNIDNVVNFCFIIENHIKLKEIILTNDIDVILFPGGPWYSIIAEEAVKDTKCKIICAYHSKPGHEILVLKSGLKKQIEIEKNVIKKLYKFSKLLFFPLYRYYKILNFRKQFQLGYDCSDAFVLLSDNFKNDFKKYYNLSDSKKITAIGNALSFDYFASKTDIDKKSKTILVAARLDESHKRISLIIKVWKRLFEKNQDWNLIVIGDGPDRDYYNNLIKKWNLTRIQLLGIQDPLVFYKDASIFLMTSAMEGWGMTLTESLQTGCVAIAMDTFVTLHEIIRNGETGFIIKDMDLRTYSEKVQYLIDNAEIRQKMALNAVKSSYQFKIDTVGKKWVDLFFYVNKDSDEK
ncbi:glycosyltransferase [Mariniflexile gromovii]|uniref:Glycosyltransferase n=1 Tax=Mariniflexile gromovii TaxID=362523 RepID=A0ABS4BPL4_9FLAO|nr:glycosyltransferase [Mariniflexile gromovii]MBP0902467.1 glycosyltransferase [Mariniflexile gromovii]